MELGGEFRFGYLVTDVRVGQKIAAVSVAGRGAPGSRRRGPGAGNSARDTFAMLPGRPPAGQALFPRPARRASPEPDRQANTARPHPRLGPAEYKLSFYAPDGRSAYTFCMCPGGHGGGAGDREGGLATNGMSVFARGPETERRPAGRRFALGTSGPTTLWPEWNSSGLGEEGVRAGGSDFFAPVQLLGDFLAAGRRPPWFVFPLPPGRAWRSVASCLPGLTETPRHGLRVFDRRMRGSPCRTRS